MYENFAKINEKYTIKFKFFYRLQYFCANNKGNKAIIIC